MELPTHWKQYERENIQSISKPNLIGFYSLDTNRDYVDDYTQLNYVKYENIKPKQVHFDLNHKINNRKKRLSKSEGLRGFLNYLKLHRNDVDVFSKKHITMDEVPFVCCRGSLRVISKQPYEVMDPTRMSVFLVNGVIYMHFLETSDMKKKKEDMTEREQTMCAWGYKFEQYIVSDEPHGDPDLSGPTDENSEFNCIFKSTIGRHNLIYGAEIDGFLHNESNDSIEEWQKKGANVAGHDDVVDYLKKQKLVELKTSRIMEEERHYNTFRRHKCLTWWLQSYFGGVDLVVCGFRNDDGIVTEINQYKTFDIPKFAKDWSTQVCLNFCDKYLTYIKQVLTMELKRQGYVVGKDINVKSYPVVNVILHRNPRGPVFVDKPLPDEDINILDDWFLDMLSK